MNILIVGCGYVGSKLASYLIADGHNVTALRRQVDGLPDGVNAVAADIFKPETLTALTQEFDYVFYTIGAKEHSDKAYYAAYVKGLGNVIKCLQKTSKNLKRFFYISSSSVYAQTHGEWLNEESETYPEEFAGKRLLEGEDLILDSGLPATVVRFAGIYGPTRTRLIRAVKSGSLEVTIDDKAFTNRIHRDDCAGLLRHLMSVSPLKTMYIGVDDEPCKKVAVYRWIANELGVKLRYEEGFESSEPKNKNKRLKNNRVTATGFKFKYSNFREGYKELLR